MLLYFAPMEGVTGAVFRRVHHEMFPGVDRYFAPFIAPDAAGRFKTSHLRALLPDNNGGVPLTPQILANSAAAFLGAAETLASLGYTELNLNAGCPSGTVVSKHKGAGMLAELDTLDAFLDEVCTRSPLPISVKTRLGLQSTTEFPKILEVFCRYPLRELIVHARDRAGMYQSVPDRAAFLAALGRCPFPLCYNGDIFSPGDFEALREQTPGLSRVMLGRGAVANPALFRQLRGGSVLQLAELRAFHDALLARSLDEGLAPSYALARMKELWFYFICLFPGSEKTAKTLYKSRRLEDYRAAAAALFEGGFFEPAQSFGAGAGN